MAKRLALGIALAIAGLIAITGIGILVARGDDRVLGAAAERSYVAGRYVLDIDGERVLAQSVKGCGVAADVIEQEANAEGIVRKHVSQPVYEPCVIDVAPSGLGKSLYEWIRSTLDRKGGPKNLSILAADYAYKVRAGSQLSNAYLTKVTFPGPDASAKEPAYLQLTIEPESWSKATGWIGTDLKASVQTATQKKWPPANFRLTIPGLDTTKVAKIGAFTATQKVAADAVGELREYEKTPGKLELGNLVVTSATANNEKFHQWFDSFVIQGNNAQSDEKTATLEYLDPNMKNVLFTLSFSGVGVFRVEEDAAESSKDKLARETFWLYLEEASFASGSLAPPPSPPPPPPTGTTPPPPAPEPPPPATTTEETVPTETTLEELAPGPEKLEALAGPERGDVQLSWAPVAEAEGYIVLFASEPGGPYEEVGRTRRTSFIISGLDSEVAYYFVVRALVFGEETADSPEAAARAG
jgi:hypothetical protein